MRIACITTSQMPSNSANSIQAMKVTHSIRALGHDVHLWVPEYEKANWDTIAEIYGVRTPFDITWLPFFTPLKQYDFCWKSIRESIHWGADVIYTWALQAAVFALLRKKATIMEFHDFPMGPLGPILFRIMMKTSGKKLILTTTRALADGIEKRFGFKFSDNELQIAPNGTDPESYADLPDPVEARKKLRLKNGLTVAYTGHFYSGRGMDLLTEIAFALPDINFLWIGGREKDVLPWREKLSRQHIQNVTITGFIPNNQLPLYQAAADILVMPYSKKISGSSGGDIAEVINPMKMFDYLSTGRAIIASEIPVFHEILNEKVAIFCEPENSKSWIHAIKKLETEPLLIKRIGIHARKLASNYSWEKRAKNTLNRLENKFK